MMQDMDQGVEAILEIDRAEIESVTGWPPDLQLSGAHESHELSAFRIQNPLAQLPWTLARMPN